jgi:UDP-glucose 4-epimerase
VTVLVTGGAGYIGSHTVRLLRDRGRDVVVLDSMEFGHRDSVLGAPLVEGRIDDGELVQRVVAEHGIESVIHFAAYKAAGESMEQPARYFANNVGGTNALLDALRQAEVDKVVFSSTCAVYGTPTKLPVDETHSLGPESPYGESKRMVEQMLAWYDTCHDLRSVSLRYFNAAGASADGRIGEDWTYTLNLVPLVMKAALGRIPSVSVFGTDYDTPDGTAIRDYVHVEDLADAHLRALEYLEAGERTTAINLGTGTGSSVREVIDAARDASGVDIPVKDTDRRPGDPVAIFGDNRRAADLLGWRPDRNLTTIVSSAWQWHSTHPDGYPD